MKKSDIATIVLIVSVSVLVAFFTTQAIFNNFATEEVNVKTIEAIDTSVAEPDPDVFNEEAINPTVEVQIDAENK